MFNPELPAIQWECILPVMIVAITGMFALVLEMLSPKTTGAAVK